MTALTQETAAAEGCRDFLIMTVGGQLLGIPTLQVHDVQRGAGVTGIPSAPLGIAGVMNVRGRVVPVIDLRHRLQLPAVPAGPQTMQIIVQYGLEAYALVVDSVGEVLSLPDRDFNRELAAIAPSWREPALGFYPVKEQQLVILDVPRLLNSLM